MGVIEGFEDVPSASASASAAGGKGKRGGGGGGDAAKVLSGSDGDGDGGLKISFKDGRSVTVNGIKASLPRGTAVRRVSAGAGAAIGSGRWGRRN